MSTINGQLRMALLFLAVVPSTIACSTTRLSDTSRTGVEQLLISNAIDTSLDKVDFSRITGAAVFIDHKYLECIDKNYVVGALRQRVFQTGARPVDKPEEADIVLELYSGAVGTDRSEGFVGIPSFSMPGPVPFELPEVKLISQTSQFATAKIGIVAYDAKTRAALAHGGVARAQSDNRNWFVMGVGPFNTGSLDSELSAAHASVEEGPQVALIHPPSHGRTAGLGAPAHTIPTSATSTPSLGASLPFTATGGQEYLTHPAVGR